VYPSAFEYFAPTTIEEAVKLLAKNPDDAKVLAGGQSLVSFLKLRFANPKYLVDLGRIAGLSYIREDGAGQIVIGALTTYAEIKESKLLLEKCPILPKAAAVVGDVQVRNRGTLGGAMAHADPAGDMPAAILAVEGDLKAIGPKGERWIPAAQFFEGMYSTALAADEILTEIRVPVLNGQRSAYLKFARRPSDFAIVGVGVCMEIRDGRCERIRIGVAGVTDKPYRATKAEQRLSGAELTPKVLEEAGAAMTEGLELIENIHATQSFRAHLAGIYLGRAIEAAQ
jgi:aerobic carbon-monoxide dehydrogenase medium subunit